MHSFGAHANMISRLSSSTTLAVWSSLWKLNVPHKAQIFCWRSLHEIIHLKSILTNRHIGLDGTCPVCHQGAEDIAHFLFKCSHARDLSSRLGIAELIDSVVAIDRSRSVILEHSLELPDSPLLIHSSLNFKLVLVVGTPAGSDVVLLTMSLSLRL